MQVVTKDKSLFLLLRSMVMLLLGSISYGIYTEFEPSFHTLRDTTKDYAILDEEVIVHAHNGNGYNPNEADHIH